MEIKRNGGFFFFNKLKFEKNMRRAWPGVKILDWNQEDHHGSHFGHELGLCPQVYYFICLLAPVSLGTQKHKKCLVPQLCLFKQ